MNITILGKDTFTEHMKHIIGLNVSHLNNIPALNELDKANIINNLNYFELSAQKIETNFNLITNLNFNNSKSLSGDCMTQYWTVQSAKIELVTASASLAKLQLAKIKDRQSYKDLDLLFNDLRTELAAILHNTTTFLNLANALRHNKRDINIMNYVQNSKCITQDKDFFIIFSTCNSPDKNLQCLINVQIIQRAEKADRLITVPHNNKSLCYKNIFKVRNLFKEAQCLPPGLSCPLTPIQDNEQLCLNNLWNNVSSPIDHCRICDNKRPIIQTGVGAIVQAKAYFKVIGNHSSLQNHTFQFKSASGELYEFNASQGIKLNSTTLIKSNLPFEIILENSTVNFTSNDNENILLESIITDYQLYQLNIWDNIDEIAHIVLNWDKYAIPAGFALTLIVVILGIKAGADTCQQKTRIRKLRRKQRKSKDEEMSKPNENLVAFLKEN